MENKTETAVMKQILDVGIWTMGLVATFAATYLIIQDHGLVPLAFGPSTMVLVLGVSGYFSVKGVEKAATGIKSRSAKEK